MHARLTRCIRIVMTTANRNRSPSLFRIKGTDVRSSTTLIILLFVVRFRFTREIRTRIALCWVLGVLGIIACIREHLLPTPSVLLEILPQPHRACSKRLRWTVHVYSVHPLHTGWSGLDDHVTHVTYRLT